MLATGAPAALAGGTGGASPDATVAPESAASSTPAPAPRAPVHTSPVTARSPRLAYKGPVYQLTASGEVVPYQPPLATGQPVPGTGGSPVGVAARAGLAGTLRERARRRAHGGAGRGAGNDLGGRSDRRPAVHLRRRPRLV